MMNHDDGGQEEETPLKYKIYGAGLLSSAGELQVAQKNFWGKVNPLIFSTQSKTTRKSCASIRTG
jgi:phenylalanine-4-hydroxylase